MFEELDIIVLKSDMKEHGLEKGDIGTVVNIYENGKAIEAEFVTAEGKTIAVLTLEVKNVRRMARSEILHVRGFAAA